MKTLNYNPIKLICVEIHKNFSLVKKKAVKLL